MLKAVVVDGVAAVGAGPVAAACERNESEHEEGGHDDFHAHRHKQDQEPITPPPRFVIAAPQLSRFGEGGHSNAMVRRRDIVASLLAVPAASLAHPARGKSYSDAGLQLYTVRGLLARDYEGTLARVAQLGYRQVEFAGLYPAAPRQTLAMLKRHDLAAPSGHAGYDDLVRDLDSALRTANELEQRFIVCPSVDARRFMSLDDWKRLGQRFNRIGADARRAGLVFAYHNHDFEFPTLGGQMGRPVPYDVLLADTDPALVKLEIDLYWMTKAGRDPLGYFQKYPGRFPLVHLKDMARDGTITELGQGTIDFRRILANAELAGIVNCFVEHDDPADPLSSIETSLRYLRQLRV
jgi:sugar phosphate isomerase/epimerase